MNCIKRTRCKTTPIQDGRRKKQMHNQITKQTETNADNKKAIQNIT